MVSTQARPSSPATAEASGSAGPARSRLLCAALQVLHEKGVMALTQTNVAAAAGLRQSHLTYYFPTRTDLLKAIVEHAAGAVLGLVGGKPEFPARSLADLRTRLIKDVSDVRMPRLMLAMSVASDEDPTLKAWMAEFEQGIHKLLASTLKALGVTVSSRDLALFHATLVGASILNANAATKASARQARVLVAAAFDRLLADARRRTADPGEAL
jgi:AcrR family transcriptional regulator